MMHTPFEETKNIFSIIKGFFVKNRGAPFIIGFQITLFVCAGLLVQGYAKLANDIAIYAYFLLVTGVILQTISFLENKENS